MSDLAIFAAGVVVVGLLVFVPLAMLDKATCNARADAMQMRRTWGLLQGCVIEHKPGKWIPLKNYRGLDD